jgi:hypothetical protein
MPFMVSPHADVDGDDAQAGVCLVVDLFWSAPDWTQPSWKLAFRDRAHVPTRHQISTAAFQRHGNHIYDRTLAHVIEPGVLLDQEEIQFYFYLLAVLLLPKLNLRLPNSYRLFVGI